jgi:hypothetical protein
MKRRVAELELELDNRDREGSESAVSGKEQSRPDDGSDADSGDMDIP